MNRYEQLKKIFKKRKCFKMVCAAGNEDIEEIRKLAIAYTIAGTTILDLSANVEVVKAAKKGIETAYKIAPTLGKEIKIEPYLSVSIGLKGDPHVRKAQINTNICTKCGECITVCRQEAITEDFIVKKYRCIGCGDCESICNFNAITYIHKKADFKNLLPQCVHYGTEIMELHAVTKDDKSVFIDWKHLNNIITDNFLSMCLDRSLLSNKHLIERVKQAYAITGERFIVQADGVPISGESDDYNTTLQAVACADIVQKIGIPIMILLSGGTNSKTGLLARQCGVKVNGVAVGSYARKIIKEFVKRDDFDEDLEVVKEAVSTAEELIQTNIEALSG